MFKFLYIYMYVYVYMFCGCKQIKNTVEYTNQPMNLKCWCSFCSRDASVSEEGMSDDVVGYTYCSTGYTI